MTETPEILFKAVAERDWPVALSSVHRLRASDNVVADQARSLLIQAVMSEIGQPYSTIQDAELEKVILLHNAGFLALAGPELDAIAEDLVARNRDHPAQAALFARHRPEAPSCKAVIGQFGPSKRTKGAATQDGTPTHVGARGIGDGRRSVFRSAQERVFFQAAARTFPGKLLVPNAALHAAIEIEVIRGFLSDSDRRQFFRVLIDMVVFDPGDNFRPSHFFELDSPWHDDPAREERDKKKERFITLAGCSLIRIRTRGPIGLSGMQTLLASALSEQP